MLLFIGKGSKSALYLQCVCVCVLFDVFLCQLTEVYVLVLTEVEVMNALFVCQ